MTGIDDEYRQRVRDEILGTTAADFRFFADVLEAAAAQGVVAVLGSEEAIDAANAERAISLQKVKVL
jgi:hypothetical protein